MENILLIRKIAWSFHRSTGSSVDDLFQEASLAYLKALDSYNPSKGAISTYMWYCITSHLKSYLNRERKMNTPLCSIEEVDIDKPISSPLLFESLTKDAQQIAAVVLKSPKKYSIKPPSLALDRIKRVMQYKGWNKFRISQGMKELKVALSYL